MSARAEAATASHCGDADDSLAWFEVQELAVPGGGEGAAFGTAVAMAGGLAAVGAPGAAGPNGRQGAVHVFERASGRFSLRQTITAEAGVESDRFGATIALLEDAILVGVPRRQIGDNPEQGAVHVFVRQAGEFVEREPLVVSEAGMFARFGAALAASGNTVVIGAPGIHRAYVFTRSAQGFARGPDLVPSDGVFAYYFGSAVAIADGTAVVGAFDARIQGNNVGSAYVFERDSGWTERGRLLASDGWVNGRFGSAVAVLPNSVVVSATARDLPDGSQGTASVFERSTLVESQVFGSDGGVGFFGFGAALAADAGTLLIGASSTQVGSNTMQGAACVLAEADGLTRGQRLTRAGGTSLELFGEAVAVSGDVALIGAPGRSLENREQGAAYVALRRVPDGGECGTDAECHSTICLSGVCCHEACGPCGTCSTGTCRPLPAESAGEPRCAPYACNGTDTECPAACRASGDCAATHYCGDGKCVPKRALDAPCEVLTQCESGRCESGRCAGAAGPGAACASDVACDSGNCADGVCCDAPCRGQCEACDVPGEIGACVPVTGAPHGDRPACPNDAGCGVGCDGTERESCAFPGAGAPCGSACADALQTDSACNGVGQCVAGAARACDNFVCADAFECKRSCNPASNDDCVPGFACGDDGRCVPGAACVEGRSRGASGMEQDCGPYACDAESGSCRTSCVEVKHCARGFVCHPDGDCIPEPPATGPSSSCGFVPRRAAGPRGVWLAGLAFLAGGIRRRRARRALGGIG